METIMQVKLMVASTQQLQKNHTMKAIFHKMKYGIGL